MSVILLYLGMGGIPVPWVAELIIVSVWREEGAFCVELLGVFPLPSSTFHCLSAVMGACLQICSNRGLIAGLSGFASHQCSIHLGADSQQWKQQVV